MGTSQHKKNQFLSLLDNTIGEEGIKTDLKITLTPHTAWRLGAVILGAIIAGGIAMEFIKGIRRNFKTTRKTKSSGTPLARPP